MSVFDDLGPEKRRRYIDVSCRCAHCNSSNTRMYVTDERDIYRIECRDCEGFVDARIKLPIYLEAQYE